MRQLRVLHRVKLRVLYPAIQKKASEEVFNRAYRINRQMRSQNLQRCQQFGFPHLNATRDVVTPEQQGATARTVGIGMDAHIRLEGSFGYVEPVLAPILQQRPLRCILRIE